MRRLPSLNGLRAFECAARHGSFTAAAAELSVTQAAVSRIVKDLEAQLGCRLFERRANRLALTDPGRLLLPELTSALDLLATATGRLAKRRGGNVLTVGVGPTFAMRWLIPRLGRFQQANPDIEILTTTGGADAPLRDDWTCCIRRGTDATPGIASVALFSPDTFPVCSARLARRLATPADLGRTTLLDVRHSPGDWSAWLARAKVDEARIARRQVFEYYAFALQAAIDGLGVAMGLAPYVMDDLAAGRLVAPFRLSVPKAQGWFLTYREGEKSAAPLAAFRDWLRLEAKAQREAAPHAPGRATRP